MGKLCKFLGDDRRAAAYIYELEHVLCLLRRCISGRACCLLRSAGRSRQPRHRRRLRAMVMGVFMIYLMRTWDTLC